MSLSKPFQNALLIPFKSLGLAVFLANLDDFLLDDFVFLLANLGPLLSGHNVRFLPYSILSCFDLIASLHKHFHVFLILLFLNFLKLLHFLSNHTSIILSVNAELGTAFHRSCYS